MLSQPRPLILRLCVFVSVAFVRRRLCGLQVSVIKAKIQAEVGLAPGKQVIKVGPTTLNNVNSLAFYNISEGKVANLSEKKRGGKR